MGPHSCSLHTLSLFESKPKLRLTYIDRVQDFYAGNVGNPKGELEGSNCRRGKKKFSLHIIYENERN